MSNYRTVTGTITKPDGTPYADTSIKFELVTGSFTDTDQFPPNKVRTTTDANGDFTVSLWCNGDGEEASTYTCHLPKRESFDFTLPYGDGSPLTLSEVRELGGDVADASFETALGYVDRRISESHVDGSAYRFLQALKTNQRDVNLVILSDSTANADYEWAERFAAALAEEWPTHTVTYSLWNHATQAYAAPTTVQTGTGSYTLHIWNGSVPGVSMYYPQGDRMPLMVTSKTPDIVIISHGHNGSITSPRIPYVDRVLALTETILYENPEASIVMIAENPQTVATRMGEVAEWVSEVCAMRGFGFINVYQAFRDYGDDWIADLMDDTAHPNEDGHTIWLEQVMRAFAWDRNLSPRPQPTSLLFNRSINLVANGDLSSWTSGLPTGWTAPASPTAAVVALDGENFETGSGGVSIRTAGTAAWIHYEVPAALRTYLEDRYVTFGVRFYRESSDMAGTAGRIGIITDLATTSSYNRGSDLSSGWFWEFITAKIPAGCAYLRLRIWADTFSGSAISVPLANDGLRHVALVGTTGFFASTPDAAANSITGDLDLRAMIAPNEWQRTSGNQTIAAKWGIAGDQRSYLLRLLASGYIALNWSPNGVDTPASFAALSLFPTTNAEALWIRVTLDVDNGAGGTTAHWYYGESDGTTEEPSTWTLAFTDTIAGTTSIFDSTTSFLVGNRIDAGEGLVGKAYRVLLYDAIDGDVAVDMHPEADALDAGVSWTSSTSEAWATLGVTGTFDVGVTVDRVVLTEGVLPSDTGLAGWSKAGPTFTSSDFPTLAAAITAIGSTASVLELVPGTAWTLTANATIPATCALLPRGGTIATAGYTLTINKLLAPSGPVRTFDTSGGGTVVLKDGTPVGNLWGAAGDNSTNDTAAIQAQISATVDTVSIGSQSGIGRAELGRGVFRTSQLVVPHGATIRGQGSAVALNTYGTKLYQIGGSNVDLIRFTGDASDFVHDVEISNLALFSDDANTVGSAISFKNAAGGGLIPGQNVRIRDIEIRNFPEHGLSVTRRALPFHARDMMIYNCDGYAIYFAPSEALSQIVTFENISGDNNQLGLIYIDNSNGSAADVFIFRSIKSEKNTNSRQEYAITLHNMNGAQVIVDGLSLVDSGAITASLGAIHITGTSQPGSVLFQGVDTRNGTTPVIVDDVAGVSVPSSVKSGIYQPTLNYASGTIAGGTPMLQLFETDGATNAKRVRFGVSAGSLEVRALNDDGTSGAALYSAARSGSTWTSFAPQTMVVLKAGTAVDADTTPSVAGINRLTLSNTGATSVTMLDDGIPDQEVTLDFTNSNTTIKANANMKLAGGLDFVGTQYDTLTVIRKAGALWLEKTRSVNA